MANVDENSEIIYVIDGSGVGGKYKVGDDLKEEVVETLATYLHCLSKDGRDGNKFQLSPTLQRKSARAANGDPAPLDDSLNGSTNPFAPTAQNVQLRSLSDSGRVFTPSIDNFITKGKADTFLKDIGDGQTDLSGQSNATQGEGPIFDAIRTALDNNRFSPGVNGPFINQGAAPLVLGRTQSEFGRHNKDGQDYLIEDLQKIGTSLMLRAAKEIKAVQQGDPFTPPESLVVGLGALIPGATQIALLKADTNDIRASAVLEENFGMPPKPRTDTEPQVHPGAKSWGHLNTPLEPYGGFLPIGMTALAVAMTVAVRVISFAFVGFLGIIVKEKLSKIPNRGPFIVGEYGKPDPPGRLFSLSAIGIRDTERDFLTVVNDGLDLFFAFDGASFRRVVREPQFYAIFVRNIVRSGNIIVQSVADVFSSGQNPLAAAQAFLGLIDVLKSSKIVAFLNIMAQLGDRAAEAREQGLDPQESKKSSLENLDPTNPVTNVMRIRNGRSDLRSGMRTSATMSKFLFPPTMMRAAEVTATGRGSDATRALAALPGGHIAQENEVGGNGRIKKEVVRAVETMLDAEYMPFYFHDLRTNEIVSFHAFLGSLEDAYSPQYESTTAYGRVDSVRTYIATERLISVSFKIVSTSKEDFDYMWWKINKLTTLVYPSWTKGRQVASGDSKFTQPFSQIPASTPVIRMRIGDVIRSNFSKTSLTRLFGAGGSEDEFNLVSAEFTSDEVLNEKKKNIRDARERMLRNPALTGDSNDGYQNGEIVILLPKRTGYAEFPGTLKPLERAKALLQQQPKKKLVITASTKVEIIGSSPTESLGGIPIVSDANYGEHNIAYYKIKVSGDVPSEMEGDFMVTYNDLAPDLGQIELIADGNTLAVPSAPDVGTLSSNSQAIGTGASDDINGPGVFSSEHNSIVRSFESVQGKGLGGVITGLTLSEMAAPNVVWETSEFGSRAPKMITINMTFAVIHDIAPGIDHTGFSRAMQYPVGAAANTLIGDNNVTDSSDAKDFFERKHNEAAVALRNPNAKSGATRGFPGGL